MGPAGCDRLNKRLSPTDDNETKLCWSDTEVIMNDFVLMIMRLEMQQSLAPKSAVHTPAGQMVKQLHEANAPHARQKGRTADFSCTLIGIHCL